MDQKKALVRLFFAKMKDEFLSLSGQEKQEFMAKDRANLDALGMTAISMIDCNEIDDEWDYIGVERWPSKEAISKREKFENDVLQIEKYVEYKTYIGSEQSFESYGKQQAKT